VFVLFALGGGGGGGDGEKGGGGDGERTPGGLGGGGGVARGGGGAIALVANDVVPESLAFSSRYASERLSVGGAVGRDGARQVERQLGPLPQVRGHGGVARVLDVLGDHHGHLDPHRTALAGSVARAAGIEHTRLAAEPARVQTPRAALPGDVHGDAVAAARPARVHGARRAARAVAIQARDAELRVAALPVGVDDARATLAAIVGGDALAVQHAAGLVHLAPRPRAPDVARARVQSRVARPRERTRVGAVAEGDGDAFARRRAAGHIRERRRNEVFRGNERLALAQRHLGQIRRAKLIVAVPFRAAHHAPHRAF
jgi:hypothetical protein